MYRLEKILPADQLRKPHPIKARIRSLGILQVDLCEALYCSPGELSRWLNNRRIMPATVERRLSEILDAVEVAGYE